MKIALQNRRIAISAALILALFFAQFPNTSVNAAKVCIGPAAYPPDLPDCLDPVVLAQQEAERVAAELLAASTAAAAKAALERAEQEAIAAAAAAATTLAEFAAAATRVSGRRTFLLVEKPRKPAEKVMISTPTTSVVCIVRSVVCTSVKGNASKYCTPSEGIATPTPS